MNCRELLESYPTSAAFDFRFASNASELGAMACSNGEVRLYRLCKINPFQENPRLQFINLLHRFDGGTMPLCLAWNPDRCEYREEVSVTTSTGYVATLKALADERLVDLFKAHAQEAWTLAWSRSADLSLASPNAPGGQAEHGEAGQAEHGETGQAEHSDGSHAGNSDTSHAEHGNGHFLYTGGDDNHIAAFDKICDTPSIPEKDRDRADTVPIQRLCAEYGPNGWFRWDPKTHKAGVTAILPLPGLAQEVLVTGSYDDHVRILTPNVRHRWELLAEENLGGGVWRLNLLESSREHGGRSYLVLASCMHAGPRVLAIARDALGKWSVEVIAKFEEHGSMNYASDAVVAARVEGKNVWNVVSTSFYDRKLCVWRFAHQC